MKVKVEMPSGKIRVVDLVECSKNRILLDFGPMLPNYCFSRKGKGSSPLATWRILPEDLNKILRNS